MVDRMVGDLGFHMSSIKDPTAEETVISDQPLCLFQVVQLIFFPFRPS
jgi:hypothetical protein